MLESDKKVTQPNKDLIFIASLLNISLIKRHNVKINKTNKDNTIKHLWLSITQGVGVAEGVEGVKIFTKLETDILNLKGNLGGWAAKGFKFIPTRTLV